MICYNLISDLIFSLYACYFSLKFLFYRRAAGLAPCFDFAVPGLGYEEMKNRKSRDLSPKPPYQYGRRENFPTFSPLHTV